MTVSYNYNNEVAPDKQTAMAIGVNFSASAAEGIEDGE